MYTGNEHLILTNDNSTSELPFTTLNFWQWAYSNLLHNMHRGKFAEFIVKCALEQGGIKTRAEVITGVEPYDLEGPVIKSTGEVSKLEIKSAAFVQSWDIVHPNKATFSIAPAKTPDSTGDYKDGSPRHRNSDIYIFTLYKAEKQTDNILDLSNWEFFVLPTYKIENDPVLWDRKTISLKTVKEICDTHSFNTLCHAIECACDDIPKDSTVHLFY